MNDDSYLLRGLERRVETANTSFPKAVESMMAHRAGRGMLGSGGTLRAFGDISLSHLTEWFADASQFAFAVTESHGPNVVAKLEAAVNSLQGNMVTYIQQRARNTGIPEGTVSQYLATVIADIEKRKTYLLDDFANGMSGSSKLKKDPLVNLVANQTNSPGAIQQLGTGTFSQTAMVQNYAPLVQAIDEAISSPEFAALTPQQKEAFVDIADTFKDEAAKPAPDVGKLQRWGKRLLNVASDLGMKVATSTIAQVLARIFVG